MPISPALRHDGAGRVAPTDVGLRFAEATAGASESVGPLTWAGEPVELGPARVDLRAEAADDALHVHVSLRATQWVHVAAARVGVEWDPETDRPLRFLRNGWHAEASSGTHALDGDPEVPADASRALPIAEDRADWQGSELVTVVGAALRGPVCLVGVQENGNAFGRIHLRRVGSRVRLEVELLIHARLEAGAELELGTLHIALGTDSSRLLTSYGASFGERAAARVWRPFLATNELPRELMQAPSDEGLASALEGLLPAREALPLDALVLCDTEPMPPSRWQDPSALPAGLERVVQAIDARGLIPGVRVAPFVAPTDAPESWRLPGAGHDLLDPGRAEVAAYLEKQAAALCDAGVRYIEIEGALEAALAASHGEAERPLAARLRAALEALRRGAGEECFLMGLDLPYGVAVGVVDAMRLVSPRASRDSVASIVSAGMSRAWMHRRLFLGNASPGPGFETRVRSEVEALAAVVATGGMVSLAARPDRLDEESRRLLATTILETLRIDRCGIPGTLRLLEPLASGTAHGFTARDVSGVYRGWVNIGEQGLDRVAEPDAELRIGDAGEVAPGRRTIAPSSGAIVHATVPHPVAVFCDFDGTFSVQDVGATLAVRYGGDRREAAWARYQGGELTPWQYNMIILNDLPVPQDELEVFLRDEIQLDPGAQAMLDFCQSRGLPFRILSDGFDWNIGRLQVLHGVSFDYEANRMHYQKGHWRIGPGAPDPTCGCGTGVCKSGVLRRHRVRHPDARLVHIGNGRVSDTCGAIEADQAFAKDSLAPELERRGEPFEPFDTLHDVIPVLERMLEEG